MITSKSNFKKYLSTCIIAIMVFSLLIYFRDDLAELSWYRFRSARFSLLLNKHNAALAMFVGNYYFEGVGHDLKIAEAAFLKALQINERVSLGHYQLARVYFMSSQFENALWEINKEIHANVGNGRAFYVRGLIYAYIGELSKAENDFRRFTLWAPKEWAGYNDLAWILIKEEKYIDAENSASKGIKEASGGEKNPWLWNHLGLAELNQKKYKEAEMSFKNAKKFVANLTLDEWRHAYPGNDPASAPSGLETFRKAVDYNLEKSMLQ